MKAFIIISGLVSLLLGAYLFANPLVTIASLGWLLGLIVFISGVSSTVGYFSQSGPRNAWNLVQHVISAFLGLLLLTSSLFSITAIVFTIVAYWTVFIGILRLILAFRLRQAGMNSAGRQIWSAIIIILIGLVFLSQPILSSAIIGRFIALILMAVGISSIFMASRLP